MHMLDIHSVQNNQYMTTYTLTSLNTVVVFFTVHHFMLQPPHIQDKFVLSWIDFNEFCEGRRSVMRAAAFGYQYSICPSLLSQHLFYSPNELGGKAALKNFQYLLQSKWFKGHIWLFCPSLDILERKLLVLFSGHNSYPTFLKITVLIKPLHVTLTDLLCIFIQCSTQKQRSVCMMKLIVIIQC